jgi:hypothetical protein
MRVWMGLVGLMLVGTLATVAVAQEPPAAGTQPPPATGTQPPPDAGTQPPPAATQESPPAAAQTPPPAAEPPAAAQPPAAATQPAPAAAPAQAQAPADTPESRIEAVKQSLTTSAASLKSYEWAQTVALSMSGEEKSRKSYKCSYGTDGKVQKTLAGAPAEEKKKKGLRGKAVEKKMAEIDASLKAAMALLDQYSPLEPTRIQAAKAAGNLSVSVPAADNRVRITIKNYLKPGDVVELEVDGAKNTLQSVAITSAMDQGEVKGPVTAKVTYSALVDGTVYTMKQAVDLTAQKLKVDVENSGYAKKAS